MRLRAFSPSVLALAGTLVAGACKDESPISHAPTHIVVVSGTNQAGNVSAALDSALVVQVLDGANKAVANVPLTWSAIGGGSLSATSTTSDANGKSSVNWTLAPTAGTQVVTVTSGQIAGASVSFVANNGATISGTITGNGVSPYGATFSRSARGANLNAAARAQAKRVPTGDRIVVGFRNDVLGVAAAATSAYRSVATARATATRIQARAAALMQSQPIAGPEVSPALLAARFRVTDAARIDAVMAALRNDPAVAYVERDGFVSIRDGAPRPMADLSIRSLSGNAAPAANSVGTKLPNDPAYWEQAWTANMLDLPKAWGITTGNSNVVVAVVDMGIRFDHPDVAANLTTDGYDFVSQLAFADTQQVCGGGTFTTIDGDGDGPDADPTDPDDLEFDDLNGCWVRNTLGDHGLWTAGIIGAVGNDGAGPAGVAWNVRIRPIRVLGTIGSGSNFDIAQGILYAAGLPATGASGATVQTTRAAIINLSLGGPGDSQTERTAVGSAIAAGSLVVASAGNDGLDLFTYPAAYPNVLSVAAVGMDGGLATYSNAGTFVSVSAPGGDFRLDDNGGGGVYGPGWNFATGKATHLFGYGTSASAPFVSGIAALLLAQNPALTNSQLKSRIEQYATRGAGLTRSDTYGWGIVNAYNALTQQTGPARSTIVRLVDATTGTLGRTAKVDANGNFVFTQVANGSYYLQAGDDESSDGVIGIPGRRFAWAGGSGKPSVFTMNGNSATAAVVVGIPMEVEPNDDNAHANVLSVNSYVAGTITTPDVRDVYAVTIPAAGVYTFETSGLVGGCGLGIELDTYISLATSTGTVVGTSSDAGAGSSPFCSRLSPTLQPGTYYVTVSTPPTPGLNNHGRYRLEVRAGN